MFYILNCHQWVLSTTDLDEPTQRDCRIDDDTQKVLVIVGGCFSGVVAIVIAIISVVCSISKCYRYKVKQTQRTKRRGDMTDSEKQCLQDTCVEMTNNLRGIDEETNQAYVEATIQHMSVCQGILRGDGTESTTVTSYDAYAETSRLT